ncbi:MAG: hypothetical protein ACKPKO_45465, partial [Candidatus Fonsibacter sp.]
LKKTLRAEPDPPATQDETGRTPTCMPEVEAIQTALKCVGSVLTCTRTLNESYVAYTEAETKLGRQPVEPTVWITQETASVIQGLAASMAQLKAYQEDCDRRRRPRKTART